VKIKRRTLKKKPGARQASLQEGEVRRALALCGLTLWVSWPRSGPTVTPHWMVERRGVRVLNFWPATRRWWWPSTGESGRTEGAWDFLSGWSGKWVLIWVQATGVMLDAAGGRAGRAVRRSGPCTRPSGCSARRDQFKRKGA
jgi:hypothetical protein